MKIRLLFLSLGILALAATLTGTGVYFLTIRKLVYDQARTLTSDTSKYFADTITHDLKAPWKSVEILSRMEAVQDAVRQREPERLAAATRLLVEFRRVLRASRCLLLDQAGIVVAASTAEGEASPVGKDFSRRPFLQKALAWEAGILLSEGVTGRRGEINLAFPIISGETVGGAVVITLPVDSVAPAISRASGIVALLDEHNVIFASNQEDWLFKVLGEGRDQDLVGILQLKGEKPARVAMSLDEQHGTATLPGHDLLFFSRARLENPAGWQVVYFYCTDQLTNRLRSSLFGTTGLMMAGMAIFVFCATLYLFNRAEVFWRQREAAERKYKAANAFLNQLFQVAADGMLVVDKEFRILRVNDTFVQMSGLKAKEIVGRKCHEVIWGPSCREVGCPMSQLLSGAKQRIEFEELKETAAGVLINCWVAAVPIYDGNGRISGVLECYRDITARVEDAISMEKAFADAHRLAEELGATNVRMQHQQTQLLKAHELLKQSQAQILQQEKMASIGQLAAGVAHEINNPMGFIASNVNSLGKYLDRLIEFVGIVTARLSEAEQGGELAVIRKKMKIDYIMTDARELLKESLEGVERVKSIVQSLKSFSRIDQSERMAADINECLESTLKIVWNELKYKCEVVKEYGPLPPTVCNPQQLNQVFMNLLLNAAQAIAEHGTISIRTWLDGGWIHARISDSGCGIPPENIKRLFEPFYTTKEVGKGTGLGLSIAYDIVVKKHHGDIQVESEVGKGSSFTVRIPVVQEGSAG
ncbi:MAG: ATP-binding protein [Thermodesulfobacteriota bacterium]